MNNPREQLHCRRRGCKYTTNRSYNLERHERNHAKGKVPVSQCQPCPHCPYAAGSLHNLTRHIGNKHPAFAVKKEKEQPQPQLPPPSPRTPSAPAEEKQELNESTEHYETSPEPEIPVQYLQSTGIEPPPNASLWYWSTPHQQEINILRRTDLQAECRIVDQTVKLFKLYTLVSVRGGAINVDAWNGVAASLSLPSGSGRHVHSKYMDSLMEFERNEEERLMECQDIKGVPSWWDDGDFIMDYKSFKRDSAHWDSQVMCPSVNVRNAVVKLITKKYYSNHLTNGKPFQRFQVKDSWLCATMLSYQTLICQMHFKNGTDQ